MSEALHTTVLRIVELEKGAVWNARLDQPKGNVIDGAMIRELHALFARARQARGLKAIVIEGEGQHFSFGASVAEHLPDRCAAMLRGLHALASAMLACDVTCLAAVRGQCLGGGLELASLCQRIFAAPDAKLAQPEIALGVFAPIASIALVERVGRAAADDLLLSGRSVDAPRALELGLVDEIAADPHAAALGYAREHLLPKSASSLRFAVRAARAGFVARFTREIAVLERLYLAELMHTADALEGLNAFVEKRAPKWSDA